MARENTRPHIDPALLARPDRPRIGVALGGGGARGFAHIGALQALLAAGLPLDVVAGTSMGAVIGCAHVCGMDLAKLALLLQHLDLHQLLGVPHSPVPEMVERAASEYLFKKATWRDGDQRKTLKQLEFYRLLTQGRRFEDVGRPFAAVACDIDTGRQVVMRTGSLARALAASVALPGIHDPVRWEGHLLVDGGVINKVPADVAAELGAQLIVAIDVSGVLSEGVNTSLHVLRQAQQITSRELMWTQLALLRKQRQVHLVVVSPVLAGIKTLNLDEVDKPVAAGRAAGRAALPEVEAALHRFYATAPVA